MKTSNILFITGTDTGVGKTVYAGLATIYLRQSGFRALALKPICSGAREDAELLRAAAGSELTLDEVNPWYFRAPLAPVLAARKERKRVLLQEVVSHIRRYARKTEMLIVEGAGGLLSPMGEDFDSRDLIKELRATPVIVSPNKLGAVNQVRLVLTALPAAARKVARIVLVEPTEPDEASRTNLGLLTEFVSANNLRVIPRLNP